MSSDPEEVSPEPQPEAIAPDFPPRVGKYEILGRLGSGAMGVVYHARDPLLERDVALKVMLPQIARDPEQKHRFEREARAVARMMHPNVVTVFDLGYHADGSPYIAMEFLSGNDLFHMMRATPPLSLERKVGIVVSVLEGLAHAHKVGIVHRDIKPANVFLTGEGGIKIMDFGVARFAMGNITSTGMVVGTAEYMSPEQVRGEVVDGRSDLFSAGAMLYELVRGSRPFHADGIMAIFYKITHDDPAFDFPYTPEYRALIPILGKALAKDAAARYQNATEFADALRPFATGLGMRAPATTVLQTPAPAAPAPVRAKEEAPPPFPPRLRPRARSRPRRPRPRCLFPSPPSSKIAAPPSTPARCSSSSATSTSGDARATCTSRGPRSGAASASSRARSSTPPATWKANISATCSSATASSPRTTSRKRARSSSPSARSSGPCSTPWASWPRESWRARSSCTCVRCSSTSRRCRT